MKVTSRNPVQSSEQVAETIGPQQGERIHQGGNRVPDSFESGARREPVDYQRSGPLQQPGPEETSVRVQAMKQETGKQQGRLGPLGREVRQLGLSDSEARQIESLPRSERQFVQNQILRGTRNPADGLRTYLELRNAQRQNPSRINNNLVHQMSQSVANGGMTRQQASGAANTLARTSQEDYDRVMGQLGRTQNARQQERILIAISNPTSVDSEGRPRANPNTVLAPLDF
jgi:hypothetical protein